MLMFRFSYSICNKRTVNLTNYTTHHLILSRATPVSIGGTEREGRKALNGNTMYPN